MITNRATPATAVYDGSGRKPPAKGPRHGAPMVASRRRLLGWVVLILLGLAGAFSLVHHLSRVDDPAKAQENLVRFLMMAFPLDFPPMADLLRAIGLTLGLTLCGTFLAAVLSVPLAYLGAASTSPGTASRFGARALGVLARAVPDYVMAIALVLLFSIGTLPGAVALGLHSVGMLSRQFADAIEDLDQGPLNALRASGAGRFQQFFTGAVPAVIPAWAASFLHRNDINLRQSVILGYAGVVGLGQDLAYALRSLDYPRAMALTCVLFLLCLLMESLSAALRQRLLGGVPSHTGGSRHRERRVPAAKAGQVRAVSVTTMLRRSWDRDRISTNLWLGSAVLALVTAVVLADFRWRDLIEVWGRIPDFVATAFPPSFGRYGGGDMIDAMGETITIALAATTLSVLLGTVVGALAASNVAPGPVVRWTCRGTLVAVRAVPEIILAITLIVATGLGTQAGVLALGIAGLALLGRFVADSLEDLPRGPQLAVTAVGGSRLQVVAAVTVPLAIPSTVGHVLYLLDHNLRSATLLGIVGGGGMGYYLNDATRIGDYSLVGAILSMVVAAVLVVEGISVLLRWALR